MPRKPHTGQPRPTPPPAPPRARACPHSTYEPTTADDCPRCLRSRIAELEELVGELVRQRDRLAAEALELRIRLQAAKWAGAGFRQYGDRLATENENLRHELERFRLVHGDDQREIAEHKDYAQCYRENNERLQAENLGRRLELETKNAELDKLRADVEELVGENLELLGVLHRIRKASGLELEAGVALVDHVEELRKLCDALDAEVESLGRYAGRVALENDRLERQVRDLQGATTRELELRRQAERKLAATKPSVAELEAEELR